jgi:tetratricopeptide (TPR) repeat protein
MRRPLASEEDLQEIHAAFPASADDPYRPPRRRRVGGWIVAVALVLAVGVVAWAVAKQSLAARQVASTPHLDPRTQRFLEDGEKALSTGDLDGAQGAFDRASVLAEKDPRVLLDEARVADAKADLPWLRLRLLAPEAIDDARATRAQLDERLQHALKGSEDALAVAPADPAAARARLDALRLAGQGGDARGLVGKVIAQASQPETAYALAALDLAEPEPLWTTVLERLRTACTGDASTARARAALVYALVRSGDGAGARQELDRLDAMPRPYSLLPELHAYVDRAGPRTAAAAAAPAAHSATAAPPQGAPAATAPPGAPPATGAAAPTPRAASAPATATPAPARTESPAPGGRGTMKEAAQALRRRDFDRARTIYEGIVASNPSDSEAIAALGDVARLQGDPAGAMAAYKRAIAINPSYLPALLALADIKWSSGDRAGAVKAYADLVDRFPEGTYPPYVKQRAEGGATAAPATAAAPAAPEREAPAAAPKPAPSTDQDGL